MDRVGHLISGLYCLLEIQMLPRLASLNVTHGHRAHTESIRDGLTGSSGPKNLRNDFDREFLCRTTLRHHVSDVVLLRSQK